jgi:hypothetical protein
MNKFAIVAIGLAAVSALALLAMPPIMNLQYASAQGCSTAVQSYKDIPGVSGRDIGAVAASCGKELGGQ